MKNKKVWIIVSAVAVVCICVCAGLWLGGNKPLEPVGTWSSSYTYNGSEFFSSIVLSDDGTYIKETYKDGSVSSNETGTYEVYEGRVLLYKNGNKTTAMEFTYQDGSLYNNDHKFVKQK